MCGWCPSMAKKAASKSRTPGPCSNIPASFCFVLFSFILFQFNLCHIVSYSFWTKRVGAVGILMLYSTWLKMRNTVKSHINS